MKKEFYRVTAVCDGEGMEPQKDGEGHRIVTVVTNRGEKRAYVACEVGAEGYVEPAVPLSRRPYYQISLNVKYAEDRETLIVNKASGDILTPFYVSKEGVKKYAFGQTYLRGPVRENWVITVWGDGRIVVDDVALPIRGGKPYLSHVTILNERFHLHLGEEFLERELQKLPDYLTQVIGPILSAYQELAKRQAVTGRRNSNPTMAEAFKKGLKKAASE